MLQLPQATGNHRANGVKVSQRTVYDCKKTLSAEHLVTLRTNWSLSQKPYVGRYCEAAEVWQTWGGVDGGTV